jgi:hypothetical protein
MQLTVLDGGGAALQQCIESVAILEIKRLHYRIGGQMLAVGRAVEFADAFGQLLRCNVKLGTFAFARIQRCRPVAQLVRAPP